jgi:glycosyltransferase involved in cell wall biosynthesis
VVSTFLHKAHFIALTAAMFDRRMRVVLNVHELMSQHIEQHFRPEQRSLMRALVRRFYPRAHAIVAVAEGVRRDLIEQFGIPARLITVVRNPLDLKGIAAQAREPLDPLPGGRNIVAVGRLVTLKGLDVLIDAFAQLPATLDAHLLIVGEGPEEARLRAQADRLRVAGRVHFLGQQRNPWKYMVRADALALPSRTEGFPNVIGEALALGVPVVAADCSPGVREYLEDGSAGLLVPPDNVIALTHALVQVLTDGALSARLRDYGPRRVSGLDMPAAIVAYEGVLAHALRA